MDNLKSFESAADDRKRAMDEMISRFSEQFDLNCAIHDLQEGYEAKAEALAAEAGGGEFWANSAHPFLRDWEEQCELPVPRDFGRGLLQELSDCTNVFAPAAGIERWVIESPDLIEKAKVTLEQSSQGDPFDYFRILIIVAANLLEGEPHVASNYITEASRVAELIQSKLDQARAYHMLARSLWPYKFMAMDRGLAILDSAKHPKRALTS